MSLGEERCGREWVARWRRSEGVRGKRGEDIVEVLGFGLR